MEGFYRLVSYFQTQSEPAFCGLASLSMVLNALAIDPGRKWKGIILNPYACAYKYDFSGFFLFKGFFAFSPYHLSY
jgi:hypothetical protein